MIKLGVYLSGIRSVSRVKFGPKSVAPLVAPGAYHRLLVGEAGGR